MIPDNKASDINLRREAETTNGRQGALNKKKKKENKSEAISVLEKESGRKSSGYSRKISCLQLATEVYPFYQIM